MNGIGDPLLRRAISGSDRVEMDDAQVQEPNIEALYAAHHRRLAALAAAIILDRSLAEDVVQDAFAGLHQHRRTVTNAVGYLQRSVVHHSISVLRRRRVAMRRPVPVADVTISPEIDETWKSIIALPPRERVVVVLRYWQDMSEADIAATVGWPKGTVKSTLHRALTRLKGELQR